ncbi:MAG TPA: methylmalonyl-CoA mutase [Deltaproteobacteria bacterium]|nr:methylmalonyl-CoA mutase [Deltaproteobacteria bacterium]HCP46709.1 methylmalonyl-CoA mutase [Deltaproteobacteria bacterium]
MVAVPKYSPSHPVRVVTAAALFDGHDAAINVMRRILQATGAEVIHLGHNRAAAEVVDAAVEEDAQAIAVSSYQGGHNEYFRYMKDLLAQRGASHIRIFGGGGGVIVPREIEALEDYGIEKIFSPEDGRELGLQGMINHLLQNSDFDPIEMETAGAGAVLAVKEGAVHAEVGPEHPVALARMISLAERRSSLPTHLASALDDWKKSRRCSTSEIRPASVFGVTGTGGAGKSSLIDELLLRFLRDYEDRTVAVLCVDPSKRRTGGALLGDRIRMNALGSARVFMRSLATRGSMAEVSEATSEALEILKLAGFDLVILETSGIGQGNSAVVDLADVTAYVMTPEYGAPSQLEKIDMIDFADLVVVNKYERRGAEDALRDVRKQYRRSRELFGDTPTDADLPVFGTIASRFNDLGVTSLYRALMDLLNEGAEGAWESSLEDPGIRASRQRTALIPPKRIRYLAEIAETVRGYKQHAQEQVDVARRLEALRVAASEVDDEGVKESIEARAEHLAPELDERSRTLLKEWPELRRGYAADEFVYQVRGRDIHVQTGVESLSGLRLPRVALPRFESDGEVLRFRLLENLPGHFPYTGGLFPFRREAEAPKRMFAGEGPPKRTNERFHFLSADEDANRLSTAFDSVTLYGEDPDERPDIWGKVGESGVSVCTLADMKILYSGFDLCAPNTSVSMTINGPAPILLAMYLNVAIDQQVDAFEQDEGRAPDEAEREAIADRTLQVVRGTVQADILKEDQAQNTCIYSTEFALKMMGDIQEYFIEKKVRNYYSVSISGYHIAEAGANPITQTAFTLANGFTLVEYYLSRGMDIDAFAPNLSFFFSNGLDPEYTVIGRVARRIWAVAMRDLYGAGERSQKLKYHIQTSGRSLHAQEIDFNDIRTTLQALLAWNDNCNSLHTNAYDEAITTPTPESVRRAMAIQLIIQQELGLAKGENTLQGAYLVDELTELVEEAVLGEFERLADRGGVLGAMERQYQRSRIQEESLLYERRKHDGSLPIIGVNTYRNPAGGMASEDDSMELRRATPEEKNGQIEALRAFQGRDAEGASEALARLQQVALDGGNIFAELVQTVRVASLGQISSALYEVGGRYRRSM